MPRMILLGTGTAVPDVDRENTHMVWDGPGGPLLIDAGGSTYQRLLRTGFDPRQLRAILLTHSHADHINGLPVLLFSLALAGRTEAMPIYGLEPTLSLVQRIIAAFELDDIVLPITWHPIQAGDTLPLASTEEENWRIRTTMTRHTRSCLALRFEDTVSGSALVHSADTAPSDDVLELARGAHTLIHEASMSEPSELHTTPGEAGEIAHKAGVKRLVLVHYSPQWTMPESQALADIAVSGFAGVAEIGREFQVLDLL
jgi:ribonuclease Z